MIDKLNEAFGVPGKLQFKTGQGDLPKAVITTPFSTAEAYLHGGHVTHFQRTGQKPVLWMSEEAVFRPDKAIRGGVPVCWPWFGPHPTDSSKPQHGFARVSKWEVKGSREMEDGSVRLDLGLEDSEESRGLWPHPFQLGLSVTVGEALELSLIFKNVGDEAVEVGAALHSYFAVSEIDNILIKGLEGGDYIDTVGGARDVKKQEGPIHFSEEVDRIYTDTEGVCVIEDPVWGRNIVVSKSGSRSTVVWNPWMDKAETMGDFPDNGYESMLCIEATNAAADVRRVEPGGMHVLGQRIEEAAG